MTMLGRGARGAATKDGKNALIPQGGGRTNDEMLTRLGDSRRTRRPSERASSDMVEGLWDFISARDNSLNP